MEVRTDDAVASTPEGTRPSVGPSPLASFSRRAAPRRLAGLLAGGVAVQAVATVALAVSAGRGRSLLLEQNAALVVASVSFAGVGAVVAGRRPRNAVGWVLLTVGALQGLLAFTEEYAIVALTGGGNPLPFGATASWLKEWIWAPGVGLAVVALPLLFPDGRPPSRRWWAVAWLGGAAVLLAGVTSAWPMWSARGPALLAEQGEAEYVVAPAWARLTDGVAFPLLVIAAAAAVASLGVRYRRAPGRRRRQLVWFLAAAATTLAGSVLLQVLPAAPGSLSEIALAVLGLLVVPSIPLAVGAAVLARRLYEIDVVVNRTLVYCGLVAMLTAGYVAVVTGIGAALPRDELTVSLVATGMVAVVFAPIRARLQRAVNRLMYGDRDDPYAALSGLARSTGSAVEPRAVVQAVADTVARALRVPYAAVELARRGVTGTEFELLAVAGSPVAEPLELPLEHGGELIGRLLVGRRRGETESPEARRLLDDLARQAAPVVQAVRLTFDLQRSRQELVAAREEERRRLRRALHDQVGPALSSAALKLGAVRRLLPADSPAEGLVDELRAEVRTTVREVRTLAYDLRPPALDQLGLRLALAEFVEERRDTGEEGWDVPVDVVVDGELPPLPAAVEVAAYWIAREALANVVRHAAAVRCRVRLAMEGSQGRRALVLAVDDDGRGLPSGALVGVGTTAMRERAEELGGTVTLSSSSAGTRLVARLPMAESAP